MLEFISQQLIFYTTLAFILFLPGYFLLLAIEVRKKLFSTLERFVFSFSLSIIVVDFLMIIIGKLGILFNKFSIISIIILFAALCFAIRKRIQYYASRRPTDNVTLKNDEINRKNNNSNFSKNQVILIILILFLSIFIRAIFLKSSIFPTATDLGHHMYWSKLITETHKLPVYQESDIINISDGYQISPPQKIADFIIGEHLIFAAISLISGANFISAFPSLVLFLVNIFGLLAIFILTLKLFEEHKYAKEIAIFSLFLLGPAFAISGTQAKFVSGGVIGNLIGNLLIPVSIYFLLRALKEKKSLFLALALFPILGMAYTHHLSTFVFIFVFIFSLIIFAILNFKDILSHLKDWLRLILSPPVIIFLLFTFYFLLFVYTPTYLNSEAINTAVGEPTKITRTGLTFSQLKLTAGEPRMALGIVGILVLFLFFARKKNYSLAIMAGWILSIFIMSLAPDWLLIDIPSSRIANYIAFPLVILAAYAFVEIFYKSTDPENKKYYLNPKILYTLFIILSTFILMSGFYDNSLSLNLESNAKEAIQTFRASNYLSEKIDKSDTVLKDHNYLTADTWIKLYFMRDYNFPLSRSFFRRYEDSITPREQCTLWMISSPNSPDAQKCFSGTETNFIMVNPLYDNAQFRKLNNFDQVYASDGINIYHRN
jgi:hypothetical protein